MEWCWRVEEQFLHLRNKKSTIYIWQTSTLYQPSPVNRKWKIIVILLLLHIHCLFDIVLTEPMAMSWYEWFIMAMSKLSRTMILIKEKLPNMIRHQNLVNSLIPVNSKLSKSMRPKAAQNKVCEVSHKLKWNSKYTINTPKMGYSHDHPKMARPECVRLPLNPWCPF